MMYDVRSIVIFCINNVHCVFDVYDAYGVYGAYGMYGVYSVHGRHCVKSPETGFVKILA